MDDYVEIIKLLKSLKEYSITGDVILLITICVAILIIIYWQKNQIKSLKEYINLWNPSRLKQEVKSYTELKDQINEAVVEQYKKQLSESKDKESEALKMINDLQTRLWEMYLDQYLTKEPDKKSGISFLVPKDSELTESVDKDEYVWTVKFRNGVIKRFKFPV